MLIRSGIARFCIVDNYCGSKGCVATESLSTRAINKQLALDPESVRKVAEFQIVRLLADSWSWSRDGYDDHYYRQGRVSAESSVARCRTVMIH